MRLRELAGSRVRYGYRRLTVMLKREGWEVNAKRIYRLYTEEGLIVRTKRRKERAQRQRIAQGPASRPNQRWSMDFVAQRLSDGRWIRVLTVVDQYTRECLTLHADTALSGEKVAAALDRIVASREAPKSIIFLFKNGETSHRNNIQLGKFGRYRTNVWNYPSANTFSRSGP